MTDLSQQEPLPAAADPTKDMLPGGEGVEPVPLEASPVLTSTVTPSAEEAELMMRQAYEAAEAAAKKAGVDPSLVWQNAPQFPGQVSQPGLSRPGKFESHVFDLSVPEQRQKHDELMTLAQRPEASFIMQRDRQWSPQTQTWHVLMELQYFEFLHTLTHTKTAAA